MTYENPFFENIRAEVNREAREMKGRFEDHDFEDEEFTREEAEHEVDRVNDRIRQGIYHRTQRIDTPLEAYRSLLTAAEEWTRMEHGHLGKDRDDPLEQFSSMLYGTASMNAWDEAERVEWMLEHQLE